MTVDEIELKQAIARHRVSTAPDLQDACMLAEAYLQEHPADDYEPITDSFLLAVTFLIMGYGYKLNDQLSVFNSSKGYRLYFTNGKGDTNPKPIADIKTRGDLRRIFTVFGIKPRVKQ